MGSHDKSKIFDANDLIAEPAGIVPPEVVAFQISPCTRTCPVGARVWSAFPVSPTSPSVPVTGLRLCARIPMPMAKTKNSTVTTTDGMMTLQEMATNSSAESELMSMMDPNNSEMVPPTVSRP